MLRNAVAGNQYRSADTLTRPDLRRLMIMSRQHRILPMIVETIRHTENVSDPFFLRSIERQAVRAVDRQAHRTADFLETYEALRDAGVRAAVFKGIILRNLYRYPEQRESVDEDLLIEASDAGICHKTLLSLDFVPDPADADPEKEGEITYLSDDGGLCLEIHKNLFSPSSPAVRECNTFFTNVMKRTVEIPVYGKTVLSLAPTDHLLYLICHAYKHLLFSGVGIRPVCDIGLLAQRCRNEIDWDYLYVCCHSLHLEVLAAAMFQIGEKYLGLYMPEKFKNITVDETDLLEDFLDGGLYGTKDMDRIHSSTITLNAVSAQKEGKTAVGILAAAFPGKASLEGRYPYLKKYPVLLPVAWICRIMRYLFGKTKRDPKKSLALGRSRVRLLNQYGLIRNDDLSPRNPI